MSSITIRHTRAEGALAEGTSRGDGSNVPLKAAGFRWSRHLGTWYLPNSRDKASKSWNIRRAAEALKAAGFEVTTEIDDETAGRDVAEREQDAYDRAQRRAEYHDGQEVKAAGRAEAAWNAEHAILDGIPMGQPILVGHHSERRHRRDLDRAENLRRRASAEAGKSEYHAERASTAERYQARREDIPRTLRRIAKLEADARKIERAMGPQQDWYWDRDPEHESYLVVFQSCGARRARQQAALDDVKAQITYWQEHVKTAEANGIKVWTRADFQRGDFARRRGQWVQVIRVNAKSLTVPAILDSRPVATVDGAQYTWTDPLPYDEVTGHKSAEEMATLLAAASEQVAS